MYPNFISHIRKYVKLDDHSVARLIQYISPLKLKRKEFLLKEGQICQSIYFVEKGCLRMFFIDDKLNEQITQFALENWWMADHFSFLDNKPSPYLIQTIEKSEILAINKTLFEEMLRELPQMERYFRIIMQRAVAASQLRNKFTYEMSKEEFYQHFNTSFPEFVQRVPQYMIASYLGLTPQYVSELRKKKL
ncbi:MAG: Crp/Fnr family transcriptional regulator [Bacteroidota bacterium]|nr:Crp/Fnr family transcriptional regulator [Bacteroidota bacterium]